MKAFATALLFAAAVSAQQDMPDMDIVDMPEIPEEPKMTWIEWATQENFYMRNMWLGAFQGLYGMSSKVNRPTEECFGDWIPEKMEQIKEYRQTSFSKRTMEQHKQAAYDVIDLIFMNDEYCHFRQAMHDIELYCAVPEATEGEEAATSPCGFGTMLSNMQQNTFSIITQVSSAAAIFKQQPWEEMDEEARGYALNQMGHSMTQLFADLIGFSALKLEQLQ